MIWNCKSVRSMQWKRWWLIWTFQSEIHRTESNSPESNYWIEVCNYCSEMKYWNGFHFPTKQNETSAINSNKFSRIELNPILFLDWIIQSDIETMAINLNKSSLAMDCELNSWSCSGRMSWTESNFRIRFELNYSSDYENDFNSLERHETTIIKSEPIGSS